MRSPETAACAIWAGSYPKKSSDNSRSLCVSCDKATVVMLGYATLVKLASVLIMIGPGRLVFTGRDLNRNARRCSPVPYDDSKVASDSPY